MDFKKQIELVLKKETRLQKIELEVPQNPDFGDYAFPCFDWAKSTNKNPNELAKSLEKIKLPKTIEKVVANGPYLNFTINKATLVKSIINKIIKEKEKYGSSNLGKNKRIMIEFSQPNTHKEFHIGHIRNTCIGDTLVRIYKFNNYKPISANYIGDIGTHVAKWIWAYTKFHKNIKAPKEKGEFLNKIYNLAVKKIEEDENYKKEVSDLLKKLEKRDPKLTKIWKTTREWSIKEFKEIYKKLGVSFDHYFYESEVEKQGQKIVDQLIKKGLAQESEGAYLIDLKEYGLDVFLIRKSDGTALYSTKDLALAVKKFKEFKIQESLYVVGFEQNHYFKQLFKSLELMGFKKTMKHISYGLVKLEGTKMSSRAGNIVLFKDLYKQVLEKAIQEVKKRHKDWSDKKIQETSNKIAAGAIKFTMLNQDTVKEIEFNIQKALNFEGDSCPYIDYVNARINSILKKIKKAEKEDYAQIRAPQEINLVKQLALFQDIVKEANIKDKPHLITNYLLKLAKLFNDFYQVCPVIKAEAEKRQARINILKSTQQVIKNAFYILNISLIEEM